jgi:hypothetical protein
VGDVLSSSMAEDGHQDEDVSKTMYTVTGLSSWVSLYRPPVEQVPDVDAEPLITSPTRVGFYCFFLDHSGSPLSGQTG